MCPSTGVLGAKRPVPTGVKAKRAERGVCGGGPVHDGSVFTAAGPGDREARPAEGRALGVSRSRLEEITLQALCLVIGVNEARAAGMLGVFDLAFQARAKPGNCI